MHPIFELCERRLARETSARLQAESLLEQKSLELLEKKLHEAKLAEQALRESEKRYQLLVELSTDAILIESEGRFIYANAAAARLFRAKDPSELEGYRMQTIAAPNCWPAVSAAINELAEGKTPSITTEEQAICLDGTIVDIAVSRIAFTYRNKPAIQVVARDISERKRLEMQLCYLASHDTLTGLANRNLLMDRLGQAILYAKRYNTQFMVCFVDLDRFKWINDTLGHDAGDQLLKNVSARIADSLRESDTLARFGGDEFVLLLQDIGSPAEAQSVLERVIAAVSTPMQLVGNELAVTCSIGCSVFPGNGETADELLKCADAAMYSAKEKGRSKVQIYDAELQNLICRRIKLGIELQHAIEREELVLHYQPQIDLENGDIVGIEALLRWRHPELGMISPAEFIPIAEDTGLITPIGEWVIMQACAQNKAWQQEGLSPVRIAVNLSPKQLSRPDLDLFVSQCLAATRLDPRCLELEFTESASMDDPDTILPLMRRLKKLGVALSIDDFGTGYSNMQYLKSFPIDRLKLDGSFVREITTDPRSLAIADAIVAMSHRLGLEVVAEMAETECQVQLLSSHGCDQVQGYYFSEPVTADKCSELLRAGRVALPQQPCQLVSPHLAHG
ncbi:MAG TPA: EAL domain-containing protein [Paucimonas sp.]|nr:EAL domain-containing protein [Paucimonas sp.]